MEQEVELGVARDTSAEQETTKKGLQDGGSWLCSCGEGGGYPRPQKGPAALHGTERAEGTSRNGQKHKVREVRVHAEAWLDTVRTPGSHWRVLSRATGSDLSFNTITLSESYKQEKGTSAGAGPIWGGGGKPGWW